MFESETICRQDNNKNKINIKKFLFVQHNNIYIHILTHICTRNTFDYKKNKNKIERRLKKLKEEKVLL
jgi:hypothetical protein